MKIDFFGDGTLYELKALPPIRFAIELERAGIAYKKLSMDALSRQQDGETVSEDDAQKVYDADLSYREMMVTAMEMMLRGESDDRASEFAGRMEVGGSDFYNNLFLLEAIALGRIKDSEIVTNYRRKESKQKQVDPVRKTESKKKGSSECSSRAHDPNGTTV